MERTHQPTIGVKELYARKHGEQDDLKVACTQLIVDREQIDGYDNMVDGGRSDASGDIADRQ